jgi:ssDNA-binding Zn-finger/Zn-ribbon topoisomerase 1
LGRHRCRHGLKFEKQAAGKTISRPFAFGRSGESRPACGNRLDSVVEGRKSTFHGMAIYPGCGYSLQLEFNVPVEVVSEQFCGESNPAMEAQ